MPWIDKSQPRREYADYAIFTQGESTMRRTRITAGVAAAVAIALVATTAVATPPGGNGRLLYQRPSKHGISDLFTIAADGSAAARIKRPGDEIEAAWSPDGSKIAFSATPGPDAPYEIWVENADGSGLKRLTNHKAFSTAPAWSPDGSKIVYASDKDGPSSKADGDRSRLRLYTMGSDGSSKQRLVTVVGRDVTDPIWSPNGNTIAFAILNATDAGFDSSIATIAPDGTGRTQLTKPGGTDELNPNWSPDGTTIAFELAKDFIKRQSDLALMNADGSNVRRLTQTPVFETNPVWSPDGARIAFTSDRDNRSISRDRLGDGFELYTMAVDGSGMTRLTHNKVPEIFPDWAPVR
jgi:Tol biopolymer transport system component